MRKMQPAAWVVGAVVLVVLGAACAAKSDSPSSGAASGGGATSGSGAASGSVAVSGSSTVLPITQLVAERFAGANPAAQVSVDGPGTGDGFVLFCEGTTDINDASRAIEPEEAKACKQAGVHYVELEIGLDGITVMTNPANTGVTCLNKGDLYALFGPESEGFSAWSDANQLAEKVGGNGNFPDVPLSIVAPGEESGTYDSFITLAGIEDQALADGVADDQAASLRPDYQSSAQDPVIIQGIEGSDTALGFVGFAYADQQGDSVAKLAIDGGDGCVEPSADTIADGSYPLSRSLFIYPNTTTAADSEALKAFVDLYVSEEGLTSAVELAKYIPLPADRQDATRSAWESAVS
jgi:phosphate transport system substrate-binding protein